MTVWKDEQSLGAEVGDLSLTDLKKIHAQIQGHKVPEEKKTEENAAKEKKKKEEEKKDEEKEAKGNDITFKKLRLDLSRKLAKKQKTYKTSLTLEGHVKFNETASSRALLEINTDGLTISGGLSDFKIPETCVTIQQAQMLIFIGFKHEKKNDKGGGKNENQSDSKDGNSDGKQLGNASKPEVIKPSESTEKDGQADEAPTSVAKTNKEEKKTKDGKQQQKRLSEFAILGIVKVEDLTVSVGFYTARNKGKMKRDWIAFGSIANLTMQEIVGEKVKGNFLDLRLDNLALIASSDDRDKKEQDEGEKDAKNKDGGKKEGQSEKTGDKLLKDTEKAVEKTGKSTQDNPKAKYGGSKDKAGKKDSSGKDKPKKDGDDEEHAGVLKTVESYNYPIKKGMS